MLKMPRSGICELLEIVFHYILYMKKIYPEKIFEKRIKCSLPIWKCRHQAVCSYILNFLVFLEKLLSNETSVEVAFIIFGKSREVIEEFIFEIDYPKKEENGKKIPKFKIEDLLASIGFALNSVSFSKSCKHGNAFELQIRSDCLEIPVEDVEDALKNVVFPWSATENKNPESWINVMPLQTVENPRFKIQIYQFQIDFEDCSGQQKRPMIVF